MIRGNNDGIPTTQELEELYNKADNGDIEAYQELLDLNYVLARRANSRLDRLKSKDMQTQASQRAEYWLSEERGRSRYSKSMHLDLDSVYEQLVEESKFLRAKTSTIIGEKERLDKMFETLASNGYITIPDDPKEASKFKQEMGKFFKSEAGQEIMKQMGGSPVALSKVSEMINRGAKVDDLLNMYNESLNRSDVDLFDVWEGWQKGNTKL